METPSKNRGRKISKVTTTALQSQAKSTLKTQPIKNAKDAAKQSEQRRISLPPASLRHQTTQASNNHHPPPPPPTFFPSSLMPPPQPQLQHRFSSFVINDENDTHETKHRIEQNNNYRRTTSPHCHSSKSGARQEQRTRQEHTLSISTLIHQVRLERDGSHHHIPIITVIIDSIIIRTEQKCIENEEFGTGSNRTPDQHSFVHHIVTVRS